MFVKTLNKKGEVVIVNLDTNASKLIEVRGNDLTFIQTDKSESVITLKSNEDAKNALEKLFRTFSLKAPFSNVLDLTEIATLESKAFVGYTIEEIAEKLKVDPRQFAILSSPFREDFIPSRTEDTIEEVGKVEEETETIEEV